MPGIQCQLYVWSAIYYTIMFILPQFAIIHECEKTFDVWLFYVYGAYLFLQAVWEIFTVFRIQKELNDKTLLSFNKWHFVELLMGAIARTDTFLDILFVTIILNCASEFIVWVSICTTFAILNLIFPLSMLMALLCKKKEGNSLYQPYLEATCFASFIRENMLVATVLDSFCINNSFYIKGYPVTFGKLMGYVSFFTQDFPQLTAHVLFKLVILSESQYKLKTQTLLLVGMVCSGFAVLISIFNMIMCAQNEFDPILLENDLMLRRDRHKRRQTEIRSEQKELKKAITMRNKEAKRRKTELFRQKNTQA